MNMGESQRALDGPTYPCDCGDVYHFPENLAVHKTACQMSKVKAALDAKTKESAGWEAERDRYRAECMDLRVAVEIRERNIGELTFQLRDANLQIGEMRNEIALLMEYIHATEFWKIEPHDQKERAAYIAKIEKAGLDTKTGKTEKPQCEKCKGNYHTGPCDTKCKHGLEFCEACVHPF